MYTPNFGSEARSIATSTVGQARSRILRRPEVRVTILYVLLTVVAFGLVSFLGHTIIIKNLLPTNSDASFWTYVITLTFIFLLGWLHTSSMKSFMTWIKPSDYLRGTLMTLLFGLIGGLTIFMLSFSPRWFDALQAQEFKANVRPLVSTVLIFPLAYFLGWAFEAYDRIPPKIYKIWRYNPLIRLPNLTERDRNNTKVVTFVLDVHYGEPNPYDMRSKIPDIMLVGDGFKLTIDEDNRKNPNRMIEIGTPRGNFYEWYFYIRRAWWSPYRFVDPYKTLGRRYLFPPGGANQLCIKRYLDQNGRNGSSPVAPFCVIPQYSYLNRYPKSISMWVIGSVITPLDQVCMEPSGSNACKMRRVGMIIQTI